ncbi:MAG: glycoside hydrolase family 5 protein [Lachnospiraceae bacterium]|nr:glycoside hydrolase family 5 protein [Lachnospiraceae bacterium]
MELVQDMNLGWNLGNSLDSCVADRDGDGILDDTPSESVDETLWGNSRTTPEIFTTLKNQGFNAVRIPVTWRDHLGDAPTYLIDEAWMNRVQEVVDYAYDLGMYVIIDLHHDGGDDTEFGAWIRKASTEKESVLEKYTAIWKQIAERFQDYSDYLIFESVNEN